MVLFGGPGISDVEDVRLVHRHDRTTIERGLEKGIISAIVVDARHPHDLAAGCDLLRALFDNPRRPRRLLHPERVLAVVATGDVEAAFAFGRYGIGGVLEAHQLGELAERLGRLADAGPTSEPLAAPVLGAPPRTALLTTRPPDDLPTVTIGYQHAPETLAGLERYRRVLREHAGDSTVFEDVATLLEVMLTEGLTCRTNLATKAGTTHTGQFIGSLAFYRELRRTRYGRIPDHPQRAIPMDAFIAIDEVVHEVLHLLFLANRVRAGIVARHPQIAEELSVTWWQGVIHNRVFPEWIHDRHILQINDDFMFCEDKQHGWEFWRIGNVFDQYAHYPWIPYVIAQLPERASYVGERADLEELVAAIEDEPAAAFLGERRAELAVPVPFDAYPRVPATLSLSAR